MKEGPSCFTPTWIASINLECPTTTPSCDDPSFTNPTYSYDHKHNVPGVGEAGCSITGGYVYRGRKIPELVGKYVFSDYCIGDIWVLEEDSSGNWKRRTILETDNFVISFGEDSEGELYVVYGFVNSFDSVYDGQLNVVKIEPAVEGTTISLARLSSSAYLLQAIKATVRGLLDFTKKVLNHFLYLLSSVQ